MLVNVLKPAAAFSTRNEGEKYVTISSIPWRFYKLKRATEPQRNDDAFTRSAKHAFRYYLDKRLGFVIDKVCSCNFVLVYIF